MKRRAGEHAYDPNCTEYLKIYYDVYVIKGAKTVLAAGVPRAPIPSGQSEVPMRGQEFVPRRIYIKPAVFERHGITEGCTGCIRLTIKLGPRVNHCDGCRARMEKIIGSTTTRLSRWLRVTRTE